MFRGSLVLRTSNVIKQKPLQRITQPNKQKHLPQFVKDYQGKDKESYQELLQKFSSKIAKSKYEEYLNRYNCFIVFDSKESDLSIRTEYSNETGKKVSSAIIHKNELDLQAFNGRFDKDVVNGNDVSLIQWLSVESPHLITNNISKTQEYGHQPLFLGVKMSHESGKDVLKNLKPFLGEFRLRYEAFTYNNLLNIAKLRTDYDTNDISYLLRILGEFGLVNPVVVHTKSYSKSGWLVFGRGDICC